MKFFRVFSIVIFSVALTLFAHAMSFSEIYYDPVGTDAGHEFIEIYNNESDPVNLTGWKLFEANSNHGLTAYAGDLILESGEYAVIADQPAQVQADFPGIETLFDSVFSLNNAGEALALKNQGGSIIDEVTYASTQGGSEDGGSLNSVGGSWVSRMPSPGAVASAAVADNSLDDETADESQNGNSNDTETDSQQENGQSSTVDNQTVSNSASVNDNDPKTKDSKYTLSLKTDQVISADDPVTFEGILKRNDLILLGGKFQWSLGDGTTFQRNKMLKFGYTYHAPGTYMVVLEYYRTSFDDEPLLQVTKKIHVIEGNIEVASVNDQGSIILANKDSKDIDLEDWRLSANGKQFTFGRNTFVLAGETLSVPSSVHRLAVSSVSAIVLDNPSGLLVAQYPIPHSNYSETSNDETSSDSDLSRITGNELQANIIGANQFASMWPWLLELLIILIIVGIGLVIMLRYHRVPEKIVTNENEGENEIHFSSDDIELLM